jgi:hemoglobin-like flavoprotein
MPGSDFVLGRLRITDRQRERLQSSLVAIMPHYENIGRDLFLRLFEMFPTMRQKFSGDTARYEGAFVRALMVAVRGLDRMEQVRLVVDDLGRRFAPLMLSEEDYGRLGAALIWALEGAHGGPFDPETRGAWEALFRVIARCMQEAAAPIQILHHKIHDLAEENDQLRQEIFALRRELHEWQTITPDNNTTVRMAA